MIRLVNRLGYNVQKCKDFYVLHYVLQNLGICKIFVTFLSVSYLNISIKNDTKIIIQVTDVVIEYHAIF